VNSGRANADERGLRRTQILGTRQRGICPRIVLR